MTSSAEPDISSPEQADLRLGSRLAAYRDHPIVTAVCKLGDAGDQGPLYLTSSSVALLGLIRGDRRMFQIGSALLAAVAVAGGATKTIKALITRSRPRRLLDEGSYESDIGGSEDKNEQSFPSGHASRSVAAACVLTRVHPAAGAASLVAAAAIGATRVAKGSHWPLDIAAGIVVGVVAEAATRPWINRVSSELFRRVFK